MILWSQIVQQREPTSLQVYREMQVKRRRTGYKKEIDELAREGEGGAGVPLKVGRQRDVHNCTRRTEKRATIVVVVFVRHVF